MPSVNILGHGVEKVEDRMELRVGDLSMVFERGLGFLRYVKWGRTEVLRGVYAALRDHNWDTIDPQVSHVALEEGADGFALSFDVECKGKGIDFFWQGKITGSAGRVEFLLDGVARSGFRRNRLGFCVLHPAECAGLGCRVEKVDGTIEEGMFPRAISPHQPFMNMKNITHAVEGVDVKVSFEGDVFEMEDQRNWTDASYKTYCTPLDVPFPVAISEGDKVRQRVVVEVAGESSGEEGGSGELLLHVDVGRGEALMDLGIGSASDGAPLTQVELARLRALHLAHLRVDLHLAQEGWRAALVRATEEAGALGIGLEMAVFVSDAAETELAGLAGALNEVPLRRFLVFHEEEKSTTRRWVDLAREKLGGLGVPIGAGSDAYFTELNRGRPPVDVLDLVSYSLNPQVHAFDDTSLVETLATQPRTVASARQFCGELPLCVTPVTLRPRFNPNATGPAPEPGPGELPAQVDVRQMSLFGAGWTAISLKYLGVSGLQSATYYETCGWRGVMERAAGSPLPEIFQSIPGAVFPLYHVLADVGEFAGGKIIHLFPSDPLRVDGFALAEGTRRRQLLVNLTGERVAVRIAGWTGPARVRLLDERNVERAMREPEAFRGEAGERIGKVESIELLPYAVARVDMEEE